MWSSGGGAGAEHGGLLDGERAARQPALDDGTILLDKADWELRFASGAAGLALDAEKGTGAFAEDQDLVHIDGAVAADAAGVQHRSHGVCEEGSDCA